MSLINPDRVFMKDLKRLDKNLGCYFEQAHKHFVITYQRPFGEPIPLFMVKADDGGFRQPDQRDLVRLYMSDTHKYDNAVRDHLRHVTNYMEDYRNRMRKQSRESIRDMTRDDKIQLMHVFGKLYGGGKGNSAFRRVAPRTRGKVFNPSYL